MLLDAALKETKLKCLSLCQQPVCLEEFSTMVFCLWRRLCFHLFFTEIHCKHQTFLSVDLECVSMVYQDSTFTWGLSVILAESLEGICVRKNFFNITELCWIWMKHHRTKWRHCITNVCHSSKTKIKLEYFGECTRKSLWESTTIGSIRHIKYLFFFLILDSMSRQNSWRLHEALASIESEGDIEMNIFISAVDCKCMYVHMYVCICICTAILLLEIYVSSDYLYLCWNMYNVVFCFLLFYLFWLQCSERTVKDMGSFNPRKLY